MIACLDLEGVLVPEIWINVASATGIEALRRTTRDEPDYDKLMRGRLAILDEHGLKLSDIQEVIGQMRPLDGAREFLAWLRGSFQVIILSDTFYEFAGPAMKKLGSPALFCNSLRVDRRGFISGYRLRQKDGKRKAVESLKRLGFHIRAVGDSYNDLTMLKTAHEGILFNPPASIRKSHPSFPVARTYGQLLKFFRR